MLKLLLAERVSIRNLHLIIEAIAEIAPHVRRTEQIVEHVRIRMAQQICGDLSENGVLKVLRLGNRWDLAFHQSLKRDAKGEVREFDIDPRQLEEFGQEATKAIRAHLDSGDRFVHRHGAGRAPLCAHDHRAAVPDTCPCCRMSRSPRASRSACSARSHERHAGERRHHGVRRLLPRRRLLPADARPVQRPRSASRSGCSWRSRATGALLIHLWDQIAPHASRNPAVLLALIVSETLIGALIGLMARLYVLALQFIASAIAMLIGYGGAAGAGIDEPDPQAALGSLISFSALMLLFVFDFHHEIIKALVHVLRSRAGQRLVQSADRRWSTSPTRSRNRSWW